MIQYLNKGVTLTGGCPREGADPSGEARKKTIAYRILQSHSVSGD